MMATANYDVLTERWILVVRLDGDREELGLLDVLRRAHELAAIRDPSPLVEFGLYRLLVAFVLDALAEAGQVPQDELDLKDLIHAGQFDATLLEEYARRCGDAFDLFHPERPFLQTVSAEEAKKPIASLDFVLSAGINPVHWQHGYEEESLTPVSNAARLLTTLSCFATEGGSGKSPSINGAPPLYVLVRGETLYQTLILNLPIPQDDASLGAVAWRNKRSVGSERTSAGQLEALTWRPRTVQLSRDNGASVRRLVFDKGDKASESLKSVRKDPSVAYRFSSAGQVPVRPRLGRPVWRDAGPLALLDRDAYSKPIYGKGGKEVDRIAFNRPDVVAHAALAWEGDLSISVYAMRVKQMKVFEWFRTDIRLPRDLSRSTRKGSVVHGWIELADKVADSLKGAIHDLFPREGASNTTQLGALGRQAETAERGYWLALEPKFGTLMRRAAGLAEDDVDDPQKTAETVAPWKAAIRHEAVAAFESVADDYDADGDALKRAVDARGHLYRRLKDILK